MSIQALSWALYADHHDLDPTARLILCVLADKSGTEGIAWPSRPLMARSAGCSVDTVDRRIRDLLERGLVEEADPQSCPVAWTSMRADRRPRAYRITGPQSAAPYDPRGRRIGVTGPQNRGHGAAAVRHEPKEPKELGPPASPDRVAHHIAEIRAALRSGAA